MKKIASEKNYRLFKDAQQDTTEARLAKLETTVAAINNKQGEVMSMLKNIHTVLQSWKPYIEIIKKESQGKDNTISKNYVRVREESSRY